MTNSNLQNNLINELIQPEILKLSAYHVPNSEGLIKLDAMENPYGLPELLKEKINQALLNQAEINRYPDPHAEDLKQSLRKAFEIDSRYEILFGNGSDELLQLIIMAVAKPNATIMSIEPSFVMYKMISQFVGLNYVGIPLNSDFSIDLPRTIEAIEKHNPAVLFIAYPNNPTSNLFDLQDIIQLINKTNGLVIIDEAYQAFAETSFIEHLQKFEHKVLIMRTLSKLGLAGLRLGYLVGLPEWISEFDKIRLPYNINVLTQTVAKIALDHIDIFNDQAKLIIQERQRVSQTLQNDLNLTVYESKANFILVKFDESKNATQIFETLRDSFKILVKNLSSGHFLLKNCLRLTIGSPEENNALIDAFKNILK